MLIVLRCLACLCLGCLWDFGLSVGCEVSLVRFGVSSNEAYEFRGVCFRISRNALEYLSWMENLNNGATKQGNNSIQFNRSDIQPASTLGLSTNPQHQDQFEINAIDQAIQAASTLDSSCPFN